MTPSRGQVTTPSVEVAAPTDEAEGGPGDVTEAEAEAEAEAEGEGGPGDVAQRARAKASGDDVYEALIGMLNSGAGETTRGGAQWSEPGERGERLAVEEGQSGEEAEADWDSQWDSELAKPESGEFANAESGKFANPEGEFANPEGEFAGDGK
eukprot:880411-Prorocentrum_minimum.AAC.1